MQIPSFCGPSYVLGEGKVSAQRAVNLYPEVAEAASANGEQHHYVTRPGLRLLATLAGSTVRGMHEASNKRAFAVAGGNLYDVTDAANAVLLYAFDEAASDEALMADNGVELMVISGTRGYLYNFATGVTTAVIDPPWLGAASLAYTDGYFVIGELNSRKWFISGFYDGSTWDALDVEEKSGQPDNLLTILECNRELWLCGEKSIEVWWNSGAADFPFERRDMVEFGLAAKDTLRKLDNWPIGVTISPEGNLVVQRAVAYRPLRVSTNAIETQLEKCRARIGEASAWTFAMNGHPFYVLNLPGVASSFVYDAKEQMWHEWTSLDARLGEIRFRAQHHCTIGGKHVVGDYASGKLYQLAADCYDDAGAAIIRRRRFATISQQRQMLFFSRLQIDMKTGVGLDGVGAGTDPQAALSWSDDDGRTWSAPRKTSIGKIGEGKMRVAWRRMGRGRDRIFELVISDPVPVVMTGAFMDAAAGAK